jgi:hypothetical protein
MMPERAQARLKGMDIAIIEHKTQISGAGIKRSFPTIIDRKDHDKERPGRFFSETVQSIGNP